MTAGELRERYARDGYVIVHDVFTPQQVTELRRQLLNIFDKPVVFPGDLPLRPNGAALRVDLATRYPALRWLLVHPPLLAALRGILGDDFVYLPEMSAHDSGYGGWHRDTGSQESVGHTFQWESDFAMLDAAIYLQDNHPLYAGGLDVVPGSHREPGGEQRDTSLTGRVRNRIDHMVHGKRLPTRVGDLVLFDFRIRHRASQPAPFLKIPPSHRKLALFFVCSANNQHARRYRDFIASREDYVYLHGDHAYPTDLLELTKPAGVELLP